MKPDFSGYATRANVRCSDGRTIQSNAFAKNDGERVPLVWQHGHSSPDNVLGHAILENRDDGVYAQGFFNESAKAKSAKEGVRHGDITRMSIYANNLVETDRIVHSGHIREVSLVLAGANPGATIENVNIKHSDGYIETLDDDAIIHSGEYFNHADEDYESEQNDDTTTSEDDETIEDIIDSMTPKQKEALLFLVNAAEGQNETSDDDDDDEEELAQSAIQHSNHEQDHSDMTRRNIFEQSSTAASAPEVTISHDDMKAILHNAERVGSLKSALLSYAEENNLEHAISNVDILIPEFKTIDGIQKYDRRVEWVQSVMNNVRKIPVARVRTLVADLTPEEARAKGYVKGNLKKEQIISLLKRTTEPTTIYKKQGIDRDDLIDITDFDIVAFYRAELRAKLMEALAEAILFGDGRSPADEDHIPTDKIRPIAYDNDFYAPKVTLPSNISPADTIDAIVRALGQYRGSGAPTLYTSNAFVTDMLLLKDLNGRRIYNTKQELASALMVANIVEVERMTDHPTIKAIVVNLRDYTIGSDKGGEATTFEDFDIDYNRYKYLIETRISGALHMPKSAVIIAHEEGESVTPQAPSFNAETSAIAIPTVTGVIYTIGGEEVTGSVTITKATEVEASAEAGYYIPANTNTSWTYVPTEEE